LRHLAPILLTLAVGACGSSPAPSGAPAGAVPPFVLSAAEVQRIILQAAAQAQADGLRAHVAVVDRQGAVIGTLDMPGAPATSVVTGVSGRGLQGLALPASLVAQTKAMTGALLSSGGQAFSTRTASFIIQDHFPVGIFDTPGGPLFGVQFSNLACSDFAAVSPLGFSGDPGGLPLYENGVLVGGIGVEGDGIYGVDLDPTDDDRPVEERAALAGSAGFEAPTAIRSDDVFLDGVSLPFANGPVPTGAPAFSAAAPIAASDGRPSRLVAATLGGVPGQMDPAHPTVAGSVLSAAEVTQILTQAAQQSSVTRAGIRRPLGSSARVSMAVVDLSGAVLGFFQNEDAPNFGIDVSVQKARTANFFSLPQAGTLLKGGGLGAYVPADLALDGTIAFTSRAVGFLAQPHFPPGIHDTEPGPFSKSAAEWSPFNTGLPLDLVKDGLFRTGGCSTRFPLLPNGITVFPGGVPLYKDGKLAGAVGVSGDGVDQDDLIASAGAAGFAPPDAMRADNVVFRDVRLPYVKFPRHPDL
jgi:uncharacterized protein GlcG (DUF336 family)